MQIKLRRPISPKHAKPFEVKENDQIRVGHWNVGLVDGIVQDVSEQDVTLAESTLVVPEEGQPNEPLIRTIAWDEIGFVRDLKRRPRSSVILVNDEDDRL